MKKFLFTAFIALFCASCGGGSSGPASGNGSSLSAAEITNANARTITVEAYLASLSSWSNLSYAKPSVTYPSTVSSGNTLGLGSILTDVTSSALHTVGTSALPLTATGNCGGTATVTFATAASSVTGSIAFSSFCTAYGANTYTVNGTFSVTGAGGTSPALTYTFTNVTLQGPANSYTVAGTIGLTNQFRTSTMNISLADNVAGKNFRLENFIVALTSEANASPRTVTVNGRFFNTESSYVDLSTTVPLSYDSGTIYPSSGQIVFTGSGRTAARITFTSATTYTVDYSINGGTSWLPAVTNGVW